MPEPLVSEDSDLQRLLQNVQSQPGAEILYQDRIRRGGLFGFFAREVHRVAYRLPSGEPASELDGESTDAEVRSSAGDDSGAASLTTDNGATSEPSGSDFVAATELPELGDLLATVEAIESAGRHSDAGPAPAQPSTD